MIIYAISSWGKHSLASPKLANIEFTIFLTIFLHSKGVWKRHSILLCLKACLAHARSNKPLTVSYSLVWTWNRKNPSVKTSFQNGQRGACFELRQNLHELVLIGNHCLIIWAISRGRSSLQVVENNTQVLPGGWRKSVVMSSLWSSSGGGHRPHC